MNNIDSTRSIRIGVMNTKTSVQEWQARSLAKLVALDKAQIVLFIIVDENRNAQMSFETIKTDHTNPVLLEIYSKCFARPSSTRITYMRQLLMAVPSIYCNVTKSTSSLNFDDEDIQTISTYDLDFILWFGSSAIDGEILNVPRYGVWTFSHSNGAKGTTGLTCFWEIYSGDDSIGAMLLRLTSENNSYVILRQGLLRVINYSYAQNIDETLFEIAQWPARVCTDIANGNGEYVNAPPSPITPCISYVPNNLQVLGFVLNIVKNRFIKIYKSLFCHQQWNIGIAYEPIHAFLKSKPKIHYLPPPRNGTFLADPFGVIKDKRVTILCENFNYNSFKGVISSMELLDHISPGSPLPVLDLPVHVSYPYLIEHGGDIYCVPETAAAREIGLYKAEEFPHRWIKVASLIKNVAAIDPTIFRHGGLWWLMCTDKEQNAFVNLFAWYAKDLFGPWKPHAANPIKTDIHSARSAGTPFEYDGFLYRPSQDCSRTYGGRIVLNRVIQLTQHKFEEEHAAIIEAHEDGSYRDGIHTISAVGDITLVDGKRIVFVGSALKRVLMRRFSKIAAYV